MADDQKKPDENAVRAEKTPPSKEDQAQKVTDNPGEGSHMFTDWALI
ncbi:MAG: hypothetical protein AAF871_09985 [Pseudomonadota bacterium]